MSSIGVRIDRRNLEESYQKAFSVNDYEAQVRLRRAINAFNLPINAEFDLDNVEVTEEGKVIYLQFNVVMLEQADRLV